MAITRYARDNGGVSAVEFALILPLMLLVFLGAFQLTQALAAYRKMTITTRTVVDLATQQPTMSTSQASAFLNASAQVMAPYPTSGLSIVLTEYTTALNGSNLVTTVTWSVALNGTALKPGTVAVLPTGLAVNGSSIVLSQVTYKYTPNVGYQLTGPFNMSDHLYMSPRQSSSVSYPNPN